MQKCKHTETNRKYLFKKIRKKKNSFFLLLFILLKMNYLKYRNNRVVLFAQWQTNLSQLRCLDFLVDICLVKWDHKQERLIPAHQVAHLTCAY